jgi:RNA polymerase sigma-70 factor (ECF subfamily)
MDDCEAIKRCRAGDKEAFRHLVEQYQRQAIGHATAILGNREDARDATQEAFLDAYQAINRFDLGRRFYPWFYVLLRNRCFKFAAKARKRESNSIEETEILSPESGLSRDELLSLELALRALSDEERELITLKHLDGLSYEELAERLEIPPGTVMSRLHYARKKLQAKLTRKFH